MKKDVRFNTFMCTTTSRKPVNFRELLERIIQGKPFTGAELMNAYTESANWQMCSVGQLCELIPRKPHRDSRCREPQDPALRTLGLRFCSDMSRLNEASQVMQNTKKLAQDALQTHLKIEERAQIVLNRIVTDEQWIQYLNEHSS